MYIYVICYQMQIKQVDLKWARIKCVLTYLWNDYEMSCGVKTDEWMGGIRVIHQTRTLMFRVFPDYRQRIYKKYDR